MTSKFGELISCSKTILKRTISSWASGGTEAPKLHRRGAIFFSKLAVVHLCPKEKHPASLHLFISWSVELFWILLLNCCSHILDIFWWFDSVTAVKLTAFHFAVSFYWLSIHTNAANAAQAASGAGRPGTAGRQRPAGGEGPDGGGPGHGRAPATWRQRPTVRAHGYPWNKIIDGAIKKKLYSVWEFVVFFGDL